MGGLPRIRLLTHPFCTRCAGFEPLKAVRFRTTNAPSLSVLRDRANLEFVSQARHAPDSHPCRFAFRRRLQSNGCDDETIRPATGNQGSLAIVLLHVSNT